jgi:hypothetical protein
MFLADLPALGFTLPEALPATQVSEFLREYFEACEGSDALDDAQVRWLLDAASGPETALLRAEEISRIPDTIPPYQTRT